LLKVIVRINSDNQNHRYGPKEKRGRNERNESQGERNNEGKKFIRDDYYTSSLRADSIVVRRLQHVSVSVKSWHHLRAVVGTSPSMFYEYTVITLCLLLLFSMNCFRTAHERIKDYYEIWVTCVSRFIMSWGWSENDIIIGNSNDRGFQFHPIHQSSGVVMVLLQALYFSWESSICTSLQSHAGLDERQFLTSAADVQRTKETYVEIKARNCCSNSSKDKE
jgi:hypothetical protein